MKAYFTTREVSREAGVTMVAVAAWARRHGVQKIGRDYAFTEIQKKKFVEKTSNMTVANGTAELAQELGVNRNAITDCAVLLGFETEIVGGRPAYVFSDEQKNKIRRMICS